MAFVQLDDAFTPLSMALSFTVLWWELCDNICIQSKASIFFGFPPVPLKHKHFWNVATHIFVFILSHWKQYLQPLFLSKSFVALKVTAMNLGRIIWCISIAEVKGKQDWSRHGMWLTATLACLPKFSIRTDAVTKTQRLIVCSILPVIGSITSFHSLLALDDLPQKACPKCRGRDVWLLQLTPRWSIPHQAHSVRKSYSLFQT